MKLLAAVVFALSMVGCATKPPLYKWGGYDELLYQSYKSPDRTEAMRVGLETHLAVLEKERALVPPGMYAEIGTIYLEKGDRLTAITYYKKERETWAESKTLMDSMIKTLESKSAEAKPIEAKPQGPSQ
jgi:hypothetical protein